MLGSNSVQRPGSIVFKYLLFLTTLIYKVKEMYN